MQQSTSQQTMIQRRTRQSEAHRRARPAPAPNISTGMRFMIQRVRSLSDEASPGAGVVSSATLLFAMGDMCRSGLFAGSTTMGQLSNLMRRRWPALAAYRGHYMDSDSPLVEELELGPHGVATTVVANVVQLARMLANDDVGAGRLRIRHLWLSLLLQPNPDQVAALDLLGKLGLEPGCMRDDFHRRIGQSPADATGDPASGVGGVGSQ